MERQNVFDHKKTALFCKALDAKYKFVTSGEIGKSVLGRSIPFVEIGSGDRTALFAASFHGSEYITTAVVLKFVSNLCSALQLGKDIEGVNIRRALEDRKLIVIPMVNPDGCDISIHGVSSAMAYSESIKKLSRGDTDHWNANVRGVDINHNFPAGWCDVKRREEDYGIICQGPTKYGGRMPASEPETVSVMKFCNTRYISYALAFHSQGEVIYWNYGDNCPPESRKMAEVLSATSGYALDVPIGTAVGGGFKDWFIEKFNRPAFTVEMGKGSNPLPDTEVDTIYKKLCEMLTVATIL